MTRLLRFLFTGSWHEHKWEEVKSGKGDVRADGTYKYDFYICRCTECGAMKKFQF